MGGYKQPFPGVNRSGSQFDTPLPDAQDSLTFNERRLDSARTTTHVADMASNMNTEAKQGMSKHNLNRSDMGTTSMPENEVQTNGTVYPNNTNINARNLGDKNHGLMYE